MKTNTFNIKVSIPAQKALNLAGTLLISLFCFINIEPLHAQNVGINATGTAALPKSSTILDLSTGNNGTLGFLPPKVALQATNVAAPITAPSNGLLVYDTVSAGAGATSVTQGFYFWNGSAWVRIQNNSPTQPYGYNTQYVVGTSDATTASSIFAAMPQMTITFTPVHSTVYLTFTASGYTNFSSTSPSLVEFEVLNGGAAAATDGYGTICIAQANNAAGAYNSGWDCSIILPISVTAGTSVTISVDWMTASGGLASTAENLVNTAPTYCHRTMFIND